MQVICPSLIRWPSNGDCLKEIELQVEKRSVGNPSAVRILLPDDCGLSFCCLVAKESLISSSLSSIPVVQKYLSISLNIFELVLQLNYYLRHRRLSNRCVVRIWTSSSDCAVRWCR